MIVSRHKESDVVQVRDAPVVLLLGVVQLGEAPVAAEVETGRNNNEDLKEIRGSYFLRYKVLATICLQNIIDNDKLLIRLRKPNVQASWEISGPLFKKCAKMGPHQRR